jgi:hypothetical protein
MRDAASNVESSVAIIFLFILFLLPAACFAAAARLTDTRRYHIVSPLSED